MNKNNKITVKNMTIIALCVTILCLSSYIVIPLPFTPIVLSFHTIIVNLIALILKPKHAFYVLLVYIIMGLMGLPVFSNGTAGAGKLFGPTGGYYFGFLFSVIIISLFKGKENKFIRYFLVTILLGIPIQHICAIFMMCLNNGFQVLAAIFTVSLPFVIGDIFKCVITSILGVTMNKVLTNIL